MATLYRQYRPKTFKEVIGQEHITDTLSRAITQDKLTHAYLLHGPRGTGKTTTARILARRLNCLDPKEAEPCGSCKSCKAMNESRHVDVLEIDAASNRGIDDVRALRDRISTAPSLGKYKVYIIDEVHMLTNEAATALLKTLEEPIGHVVFILATTELYKVLPTILSRCQVFRFRRATRDEMIGRLSFLLKEEKREAEDDVLNFITDRSDGCYRDAESLLGQVLTLQEGKLEQDTLVSLMGLPSNEIMENFLSGLEKDESAQALEAIDEAFSLGIDPEQFLKESIRAGRDKALAIDASNRWPVIVRALVQAVQDLSYVPQPLLAIHLAVITVCTKKGTEVLEKKPESPKQVVPAPLKPVPTPEEKIESKKEDAPATKIATDSAPVQDAASSAGLDKITRVWDDLVSNVKGSNPVASTFLRAVEPISVNDGVVTLRTQYSLHKNYFDNPRHKKLTEEALSKLVGEKITLTSLLDEENGRRPSSMVDQRKQKETDFKKTVEDVFG